MRPSLQTAHAPVRCLWGLCRACMLLSLMPFITTGAGSTRKVWPTVSHTWPHMPPGGLGMWCQRQVPGWHHLNNASCLALVLAGAALWSAPETSVARVFNHLSCTSPLSINPSLLLHSLQASHPSFTMKKLMRSPLSFHLSLCVCVHIWTGVYACTIWEQLPVFCMPVAFSASEKK